MILHIDIDRYMIKGATSKASLTHNYQRSPTLSSTQNDAFTSNRPSLSTSNGSADGQATDPL